LEGERPLVGRSAECGVGRMPAAESETSVPRYFGYVITRSIGRWEEGSAIGVLYSRDDVN
jgi:hypothetical protein